MGVSFQVKGISKTSAALRRLAAQAPEAAARGLNLIAEATMTDSKEHTPVQYGRLKASGIVAEHAEAGKLRARLAYGTEYAVFVHERTRLRHRVGEAKFLERAVMRAARTFARDLADEIRASLKG